jgi:hypothetical protein
MGASAELLMDLLALVVTSAAACCIGVAGAGVESVRRVAAALRRVCSGACVYSAGLARGTCHQNERTPLQ